MVRLLLCQLLCLCHPLGKAGLLKRTSSIAGDQGCVGTEKESSSFDSMNNIVANLLLNVTSSARFEGESRLCLTVTKCSFITVTVLHGF